jgi:hypothetical protein
MMESLVLSTSGSAERGVEGHMTRSFLVFLVCLPLAFAVGGMYGYVLGCEHGAKAGYTQALKELGRTKAPV